jgi:hypothetical protein
MAIVYLENDDEITSAIAKIRAVSDGEALVVVPPGSKIATSRINFKLLTREAAEKQLNVVAVSDEPQVRALAISAGMPAYDSVAAAQQALATYRARGEVLAGQIQRTMPREHPDPSSRDGSQTQVYQVIPSAAPVESDTAVLPAQHGVAARKRPQSRRVPIAPVLVVGLALLLVVAVGYGAFVFLPTATITIRPTASRIQAPAFTVTADPTVAVVDPVAGVIPAQRLDVPVHVSGTFPATGIDVHDTRASGTVRFRSENTLNAVEIPANTTVSTADGTEFTTVGVVTVPKASFATGPTQVDAEVRAVKPGIKGNVDAGTVTVLPQVLASQLITINNPEPIAGGKHVEEQVVSQADYDSAAATLSSQLDAALATSLLNTQNVPRGLVAYADTAEMSAAQPNQLAADLVGTPATSFTLGLDSTARVTAVNESLIGDVAAARLRAALARGQKLVGDEVTAAHAAGTVSGDTIVYTVLASGLGYTDPNPETLVTAVLGRSLAEARAALSSVGSADIKVWPDFVDHLPDQPGRISVTVVPPSAPPATMPPSPATRSPSVPTQAPTARPSSSSAPGPTAS